MIDDDPFYGERLTRAADEYCSLLDRYIESAGIEAATEHGLRETLVVFVARNHGVDGVAILDRITLDVMGTDYGAPYI